MQEILNSFFSSSLPSLYIHPNIYCAFCAKLRRYSPCPLSGGERDKRTTSDKNMKAPNRLGHRSGGGAPKSGGRGERESGKTLSVLCLRSLPHPSKERIILIFHLRTLARMGWGNGLRGAGAVCKNLKTRPNLSGEPVPHCPLRALSTHKEGLTMACIQKT